MQDSQYFSEGVTYLQLRSYFSVTALQTKNSRPLKYPVTGTLVVPSPAPFMGVTWNSYTTLLLVSLYSFIVKLNSEMLTTLLIEEVLKGAPASVMSTRYQMSGSTPVMSKLNGASQVRWITGPRQSVLRLLTTSSRPERVHHNNVIELAESYP